MIPTTTCRTWIGLLALLLTGVGFAATDNDPMKVRGDSSFPIRNPIDSYVLHKLNEAKIQPSGRCTDEEFVRRAYLDVCGVIPTPEGVKLFLADPNSNKRAKLIDRLLASERYGAHWAIVWGDLLREHSRPSQDEGSFPGTYREWLKKALNENVPYDKFATELLSAQGSADLNGAVNFYLRDAQNRVETANTISSALMGTRMACAQCHDHPFDKWEQKDFHSLMAFLNPRTRVNIDELATVARLKNANNIPDDLKGKLQGYIAEAEKGLEARRAAPAQPEAKSPQAEQGGRRRGGQGGGGTGPYAGLFKKIEQDIQKSLGADKAERFRQIYYGSRVNVVSETFRGDYHMPAEGDGQVRGRGGEVVEAVFPWDNTQKAAAEGSRRAELAKFMVAHPQFAKVQVNRLWAALQGRGIVHPVDDFRPKNPPSHPELLDYLAAELVNSKFDTKHVLRLILTSSAYERSSKSNSTNKADETLFSHRILRRMTAEQLYDSILVATGQADPGVALADVPKAPDLAAPPPKAPTTKGTGISAPPAQPATGMMGNGPKMNGGMDMTPEAYNAAGMWAFDQPTPADRGSFMQNFNQPNREEFISERDSAATITQALELFNGRPINENVRADKNGVLQKLSNTKLLPAQVAQELYLTTLSRMPNATELGVAGGYIASPNKGRLEDLHWALLNTREFMFIK